jgi:TolA-binding protein
MADDSLKGRVTRQGEDAIGRLAQELLESPIVSGALSRAFETRERAMRAQELAMGALNLPSAGDLERLTRRVRSVSQRLESIEDGLDRVEGRLSRPSSDERLEERLERIEALLQRLESERQATAPKPPRAPRTTKGRPKRSGPAAG